MRATTLTLETARNILSLDFLDLWINVGGEICCYLTQNSPTFPSNLKPNNTFYNERTELGRSLIKLRNEAKGPNENFCWITDNSFNDSISSLSVADVVEQKMVTKMAVRMPNANLLSDDETDKQIDGIYLVGGSFRKIPLNNYYSRYIFSIGETLNVALFSIDKFNKSTNCLPKDNNSDIILPILIADRSIKKSDYTNNFSKSTIKTFQSEDTSYESSLILENEKSVLSMLNGIENEGEKKVGHLFSVNKIPVQSNYDDNFDFNQIKNLSQFAEGTNSKVYIGMLNDKQIVVKMMTANKKVTDGVANSEYDTEFDILCRVNHPGIIQIIAKGNNPRKFLVLEWLGGGTLDKMFKRNMKAKSLSAIMGFSKDNHTCNQNLTFSKAISYAYELASSLSYLHSQCYPGATIIHRDLKPENIAFTDDGKLKLLDFGLCACVKTRQTSTDTYEMTGNTGSLRYMAPEVILCRPYTEKADVYSFAILVWQMATQEIPYSEITSRVALVSRVARGNERPKISPKWPVSFKILLEACWHHEYDQRPSFDTISSELLKLNEEMIATSLMVAAPPTLPEIKLPSLKRNVFRNR